MTLEEAVPKEQTTIEPDTGEKPVLKVEPPQQEYEEKRTIVKKRHILWYVWTVVEALLLIRFLIRLLGANPLNLFSTLVDILSVPFVFLFAGLFTPSFSADGDMKIEWSTLFAIFVYAVIAFLVSRFYIINKPISPKEAEKKAEKTTPS